MSFWQEVFSDNEGRPSSQRVMNAIGVGIGSLVVMYLTLMGKIEWQIFGIYIASTGGVYGLGSWKDNDVKIQKIRAENPQPSPPDIPFLAPTTTINVGKSEKLPDEVMDMNVSAKGKVTVNKGRKR